MVNRLFPVQTWHSPRNEGRCPESVYMRAYEVYVAMYGEQKAMVDLDKGCRGGFSTGEIVCFLYAHSFPREEWRDRFNEAMDGLKV